MTDRMLRPEPDGLFTAPGMHQVFERVKTIAAKIVNAATGKTETVAQVKDRCPFCRKEPAICTQIHNNEKFYRCPHCKKRWRVEI